MSVIVQCGACGKRLRAPVALAGKRVRCKCGEKIHVPFPNEPDGRAAPATAARDASIVPPPSGDVQPADLTDLAMLADGDHVSEGKTCPACFANMADDAVLCTACGFDVRSGRKVRSAEDRVDDHRGSAQTATEDSAGHRPVGKGARPRVGEGPPAPDKKSALSFVGSLAKPLLILVIVAGVAGFGWYLKSAIFFNPKDQMESDHAKIFPGMTVKQVVQALDKKPKSVETVRVDGKGAGLLGKMIPRKLAYKDNFVRQYSKEDLRFGFTFVFRYSERAELHVNFQPNGRVQSAEKHDPLARLGI